MCGSSQPPPDDKHHDLVVQLVNVQQKQNSVVERHNNAIDALFYMLLAVLGAIVIYVIYKAIIRYERIKTNIAVRRAVDTSA